MQRCENISDGDPDMASRWQTFPSNATAALEANDWEPLAVRQGADLLVSDTSCAIICS